MDGSSEDIGADYLLHTGSALLVADAMAVRRTLFRRRYPFVVPQPLPRSGLWNALVLCVSFLHSVPQPLLKSGMRDTLSSSVSLDTPSRNPSQGRGCGMPSVITFQGHYLPTAPCLGHSKPSAPCRRPLRVHRRRMCTTCSNRFFGPSLHGMSYSRAQPLSPHRHRPPLCSLCSRPSPPCLFFVRYIRTTASSHTDVEHDLMLRP